MSLSERERQANRLIQRGDIESAINSIFDLVSEWAKAKDFDKASFWREKIIEIDPMALAKHYDAGEVINDEKASMMDTAHHSLWTTLYNSLRKEERKELYSNLQPREFPSGKIIIRQGKLNKALFFIEEGHLKNIFSMGGKENFLHDFGQGDIVGGDTFFKASVCTSTVVTVSMVKLKFIDRNSMDKLDQNFSDFSKRLDGICSWLEARKDKFSLKNKAIERRQNKRHNVSGKVILQTFDIEKNPIRPAYSGWMEDISIGGSSFIIRCADGDVGRAILGRATTLSVKFENGPESEFDGQILGARFDFKGTYKINLKFEHIFPEEEIKEIVASSSPSSSID
ncbi:MAG: cyclic nucleotide-binding domain-containing protein [Nitrospinales bacterium]